MLNDLPKDELKVFKGSLEHFSRTYRSQRKRAAYRLKNERINEITFHTFRHWRATMEYHRTKDILHVMQMLGHKRIENTLKYTHLVQLDDADAYVCKVTKDDNEMKALTESGFEYVCENDGLKFFRKPK